MGGTTDRQAAELAERIRDWHPGGYDRQRWERRRQRALDLIPADPAAADRDRPGWERRAAEALYELVSDIAVFEATTAPPPPDDPGRPFCRFYNPRYNRHWPVPVTAGLKGLNDPGPFVFGGPPAVARLLLDCHRWVDRLVRDWLPDDSPALVQLADALAAAPRNGLGGSLRSWVIFFADCILPPGWPGRAWPVPPPDLCRADASLVAERLTACNPLLDAARREDRPAWLSADSNRSLTALRDSLRRFNAAQELAAAPAATVVANLEAFARTLVADGLAERAREAAAAVSDLARDLVVALLDLVAPCPAVPPAGSPVHPPAGSRERARRARVGDSRQATAVRRMVGDLLRAGPHARAARDEVCWRIPQLVYRERECAGEVRSTRDTPAWRNNTLTTPTRASEWGGVRFRRNTVQAIILSAFEAAGWPERVQIDMRPAQLRATLKNMGRTLGRACPIRFEKCRGKAAARWSWRSPAGRGQGPCDARTGGAMPVSTTAAALADLL